jgi:hypothetical protein
MSSIFQRFGLTIAAVAIMFAGCNKDDEKVIPAFSVPVASVEEGSSTTVSITAGKAPFTAQGFDASVASVTVSGDALNITGAGAGATSVKVVGKDGGEAILGISVSPRPDNAPIVDKQLVEVAEDGTATVAVSGVTTGLTAVSAQTNIAGVAVSGTTVTVTGYSPGTTTVTVKNSENVTASFVVDVTGEQIFFGPDRSQLGSGNKSFFITESHTIKKGVYTMCGWIYVADGATLTIEPGTVIKGTDFSFDGTKSAQGSSLIIRMGGKIMAEGTVNEPIVFTSNNAPGQRQASDWGGIILLGRARNNQGTMTIEGGVDGPHGGSDDEDSSGTMRYVRIEFAGYPFAKDNEINGLTFGSVGSGTTIDHIQVSYCGDDSFEWFGGSVNCKYLVAYHGWDDEFDTDNGFSGKMQFLLSVRDPKVADQSNSNGFESDNNAGGTTQTPLTSAVFSNVTIIGPMGQDPDFENYDNDYPNASLPAGAGKYITGYGWSNTSTSVEPIRTGIFQAAMQIRRNSRMSCFNSVLTGYPVGLMLVPGYAGSGNTGNYGTGTHESATNGDLKVKNVFFAGMGMTGADVDNKLNNWTGLGDEGFNFSADYFLNHAGLNNREFAPADQSYAAIKASIDELKLKDFQSKLLPLTYENGVAKNNPEANWGPTTGSPLLGAADFTDAFLNDPFFEQVTYAGAFASDSDADNWTKGWTNFDPQNTDY